MQDVREINREGLLRARGVTCDERERHMLADQPSARPAHPYLARFSWPFKCDLGPCNLLNLIAELVMCQIPQPWILESHPDGRSPGRMGHPYTMIVEGIGIDLA